MRNKLSIGCIFIFIILFLCSCYDGIAVVNDNPDESDNHIEESEKYYIPVFTFESANPKSINLAPEEVNIISDSIVYEAFTNLSPGILAVDSLSDGMTYEIDVFGYPMELSLSITDEGYRFKGNVEDDYFADFLFSNDMKSFSYVTGVSFTYHDSYQDEDEQTVFLVLSFGNNLKINEDESIVGEIAVVDAYSFIDSNGVQTIAGFEAVKAEQFSKGSQFYAFLYELGIFDSSDSAFPDELKTADLLDFDLVDIICSTVIDSSSFNYLGGLISYDKATRIADFNYLDQFSLSEVMDYASTVSQGSWHIVHNNYPNDVSHSTGFVFSGEYRGGTYQDYGHYINDVEVCSHSYTCKIEEEGTFKQSTKYFREDGNLLTDNIYLYYYTLQPENTISLMHTQYPNVEPTVYKYYIANSTGKQYLLLYENSSSSRNLLLIRDSDIEPDAFTCDDIIGTWGDNNKTISINGDNTVTINMNIYESSITGNVLHLTHETLDDEYYLIMEGRVLVQFDPDEDILAGNILFEIE